MPKDDIKSLLGEAKDELKAVIRPKQSTVRDGMLQPADGSAPGSARATVPRPRPKEDPLPTMIVPGYDDFAAREAPTAPARPRRRPEPLPQAYPSLPPVDAPVLTPSVMASVSRVPLGRLLVVIAASGAAVTGVVAAIGASVVNVIVALRPPSNADIERKLQAIETRVNGDFGLPLEQKTRQEKDAELERKVEAVGREVKALRNALPTKVKVQVNPKASDGE
jgi:hypothetical protein